MRYVHIGHVELCFRQANYIWQCLTGWGGSVLSWDGIIHTNVQISAISHLSPQSSCVQKLATYKSWPWSHIATDFSHHPHGYNLIRVISPHHPYSSNIHIQLIWIMVAFGIVTCDIYLCPHGHICNSITWHGIQCHHYCNWLIYIPNFSIYFAFLHFKNAFS